MNTGNSNSRFAVCVAALLVCRVVASGSDAGHGHATATHDTLKSEPPVAVAEQSGKHDDVPAEINPALRNSAESLATSNLISTGQPDKAVSPGKDYKAILESAIELKQDKQFKEAEAQFVRVLNSAAPVELHRTACLELALMAQDNKQSIRAQQIFSQFVSRFPDDPGTAEVLLRQGLLYREMGAPVMALSKFYAVMSTALRLKLDRLDYYQRLVLQAQTEIADTYYLQGKFNEAAEFQQRLLKLDSPLLNRPQVVFKLIRSLSSLARDGEVVAQSDIFISKYPDSPDVAEVRFMMADSLKKLGRTREAMQQVLTLLQSQQAAAAQRPADWVYWQQRTGNEIANQLYKEGDYLSSLEIYRTLSGLNTNAAWQLPAWYQMGLVYERLQQPQKAAETYARILEREKEITGENASASLSAVLDMARWRKEHIEWQLKTEKSIVSKSKDETVAAAP